MSTLGFGPMLTPIFYACVSPGLVQLTPSAACEKDVEAAINLIAQTEGLLLEAHEQDAKTLVSTGTATLSYKRDGDHYAYDFGAFQDEGATVLRAYKRAVGKPGKTTVSPSNFGEAKLTRCFGPQHWELDEHCGDARLVVGRDLLNIVSVDKLRPFYGRGEHRLGLRGIDDALGHGRW